MKLAVYILVMLLSRAGPRGVVYGGGGGEALEAKGLKRAAEAVSRGGV